MSDVRWGQFSRRVCWLVLPSVFDLQIPDDHTIMYVLTESPDGSFGNHVPREICRSIDREQMALQSKWFYANRRNHNIVTYWYDPSGNRVKKFEVIQKMRELAMIAEHESTGEFQLEHGK